MRLIFTALDAVFHIFLSSTTAFAPTITTKTKADKTVCSNCVSSRSIGNAVPQTSTLLQAVMLPGEGEILPLLSMDLSTRQDESHIVPEQSYPFTGVNKGTQSQSQPQEQMRGLITIIFLFASNSPVLHTVFTSEAAPPVLLVNAAISSVVLLGLVLGGGLLEAKAQPSRTSALKQDWSNDDVPDSRSTSKLRFQAGVELGFWKFLGTSANLAGLSLTTANHGAFLIQLTTLIVPVVQGIMGVPLSKRTQFSVLLALAGDIMFTQDSGGSNAALLEHASTMPQGDALCVAAAGFYAAYDLRLFDYDKKMPLES